MSEETKVKNGLNGWMIVSIVLALALISVLVWTFTNNETEGKEVATVNGEKITKQNLYDELVLYSGADVLDSLIGEKLVEQEMKKANLAYTQKELDDEAASVKKQMGGEENFQAALQQYGMTESYFMQQMLLNVQLKKLLADKISVTDEEAKAYFEENKKSFVTPEQIYLHQIVVATKEEAAAIQKELQAGGDFASIAKEKSTDTSSKAAGGVVGLMAKGYLDDAVEKVAFSIETNKVSDPIEGEDGFYIIKVTEHNAQKEANYEDSEASIKETLSNTKLSEQSSTWITDVKAKAKIVNHLTTEN